MRPTLPLLTALLALGIAPALADSERTLLAQEREATKELPLPGSESDDADVPLQPKLPPRYADETVPSVRIRVDERTGERVEEYRINGRLHMVKVTPLRGAPYYLLDTNGDGQLDRRDFDGPVGPVYWVLHRWD